MLWLSNKRLIHNVGTAYWWLMKWFGNRYKTDEMYLVPTKCILCRDGIHAVRCTQIPNLIINGQHAVRDRTSHSPLTLQPPPCNDEPISVFFVPVRSLTWDCGENTFGFVLAIGKVGGGSLHRQNCQLRQSFDRESLLLIPYCHFEIAEIAANFANCLYWQFRHWRLWRHLRHKTCFRFVVFAAFRICSLKSCDEGVL